MNTTWKMMFWMLMLCACSSSRKETEQLKQAAEIHHAITEQVEELEMQLSKWEAEKSISLDSIYAWREIIKSWEQDLPEVPGYEEHDHQHTHSHQPELTPEEILHVHIEMKRQFEDLNARMEQYKK